MPARIIIGADLVPTQSNYEYFEKGDIDTLIGKEIRKKLQEADFTIFNLEVPLTNKEIPIKKYGPNLIAPVETIEGLKAINPHFFTIANNHILDQGEQGLYSTINILEKAGIAYAGAGKDLTEAIKPYIYEKDGVKVGIYCCTEHEFTIATEVSPGANPFDPLESLGHVSELKKQCDYLIVLYHGGREHYRYPSPWLQKICRKLVDYGANLVVCQHSHCIGCEEKWKEGIIVYGQGNFLFDHNKSDFWKTSLLIELNENFQVKFLPLVKQKNKVRIANKEQAEKILKEFEHRSSQILESGFIQDSYHQFSTQMLDGYYSTSLGRIRSNFFSKVINKLAGNKLVEKCFGEKNSLALLNVIECEAHQELFIDGLKGRIYGRRR